ncbi:MAG: hypothetical protein WC464_05985 [Bdellovibrionales bacterium]
MPDISDLFTELTDVFLEETKYRNSWPFAVNKNYNPRSGQVEFVLYPQRNGFAEEVALTPEFVALKGKIDGFQKLLLSVGVEAQYMEINKKTIRASAAFPAGARPAWALQGFVPDTEDVADALKKIIIGMKPDAISARAGTVNRLRDEKVEQVIPGHKYH